VIKGVPAGAKSLALLVEDPDAPGGLWVHWLLWNINPHTAEIAENSVPREAIAGKNDFHRNSYGGPCPPSGRHRYFFRLFALDTTIDLAGGVTKAALEDAMEDHIIARTELVGLYGKT
jgi:Raf kinase inhibitor-like YbhB/YbcL family protein